jgi:myosin heavy subunit
MVLGTWQPMGIMSILDEESFFPQATDKSFIEKLHATHDGKSAKYSKLRLNPTMFSIAHYAGLVRVPDRAL